MWEYKTVRTKIFGFQNADTKWYMTGMDMVPTDVLDEMLNELGVADWELVNFSQTGFDSINAELLFVLKRPRKN